MTPSEQPEKRRRGEPWALGTVLGYASANNFDDFASKHTDPLVGPFLRGLPSLILGIVLVLKNRTFSQLRASSPDYIGRRAILPFILAGVISTVGLFLYYFAMRVGGVAIVVPVQETYVIWGTLIAWFFLHERIHRYAVLGIVLIFVGLLVLTTGQWWGKPITPYWYWAIPLAFSTALTYGVSGVLWRLGQLRGAHQSIAIFLQFSTSVLVGLIGWLALGRGSVFTGPNWKVIGALLLSGVLSGVFAIYCMFTALRLMAVARVYAFSSLTPLTATVIAVLFLHEDLNAIMATGILLVSAGVVLTQIFRPRDEQQA
jgi:drug/metabolite transporter (DMT)-like permease